MKFYQALITVLTLVVIMFFSLVKLGSTPQIPLLFGCLIAGLVAMWAGYRWDDILDGMISGITRALEAILILCLIGVLIGVWIASGTVPTMIYYGLQIISPQVFVPSAMLICTVISFIIGAWGTVGTVGLALMGVGMALGIPAPIVAGCIVSGSYAGEVISPLSDATNLTAAVVREPVPSIVGRMLKPTVIFIMISLVLYAVVGFKYASHDASAVEENIAPLLESIRGQFHISIVALIPLAAMIVCILSKVPALASMMAGIIIAIGEAILLQGQHIGDLLNMSYYGFECNSGNEMEDSLLSAGGLNEMLYTISTIIIAMAFGGLMQHTGQMDVLISPILKKVRSFGGMNALTIGTCAFVNAAVPDQYLGISFPGLMYDKAYRQRGYTGVDLSMGMRSGGAVTSVLIPWNTCGTYVFTILGISSLQFAPYAFFCLILPIGMTLYGFAWNMKGLSVLRRTANGENTKEVSVMVNFFSKLIDGFRNYADAYAKVTRTVC